jgi:hypothetical protein
MTLQPELLKRKRLATTTILKKLSPAGLARLKHEAEVMIRREAMKAKTKILNNPRMLWAAGLLYLLDGICQNLKM